jgi:hypothetical protein
VEALVAVIEAEKAAEAEKAGKKAVPTPQGQ